MQNLYTPLGRLLSTAGNFVFTASFFWGLWILGSQCLLWLRIKVWEEKPFAYYLGEIIKQEWLFYPRDWLGVHSALYGLNAGVGIVILGLIIGGGLALIGSTLRLKAPISPN